MNQTQNKDLKQQIAYAAPRPYPNGFEPHYFGEDDEEMEFFFKKEVKSDD